MLNEVNMDFRIPGLPHSVMIFCGATNWTVMRRAGDEVCVTREVPRRVSAETERQTPRRVRLSASDRTPERTHRIGERVDRILERVDRILQGSLGQGRVRRTCRPGSRRRTARRKQAAQCSFPKELNRPSRTISHHRARAGENAADPRNQPRVASEKEAQHRRRS